MKTLNVSKSAVALAWLVAERGVDEKSMTAFRQSCAIIDKSKELLGECPIQDGPEGWKLEFGDEKVDLVLEDAEFTLLKKAWDKPWPGLNSLRSGKTQDEGEFRRRLALELDGALQQKE